MYAVEESPQREERPRHPYPPTVDPNSSSSCRKAQTVDTWPLLRCGWPSVTLMLLLACRWEYDESYCDAVKKTSPYDSGPRLLDIIDTAVFDYLIGNADRHHYESFQDDEGASMLILLDNAKRYRAAGLAFVCVYVRGTFSRALCQSAFRHKY